MMRRSEFETFVFSFYCSMVDNIRERHFYFSLKFPLQINKNKRSLQ